MDVLSSGDAVRTKYSSPLPTALEADDTQARMQTEIRLGIKTLTELVELALAQCKNCSDRLTALRNITALSLDDRKPKAIIDLLLKWGYRISVAGGGLVTTTLRDSEKVVTSTPPQSMTSSVTVGL